MGSTSGGIASMAPCWEIPSGRLQVVMRASFVPSGKQVLARCFAYLVSGVIPNVALLENISALQWTFTTLFVKCKLFEVILAELCVERF